MPSPSHPNIALTPRQIDAKVRHSDPLVREALSMLFRDLPCTRSSTLEYSLIGHLAQRRSVFPEMPLRGKITPYRTTQVLNILIDKGLLSKEGRDWIVPEHTQSYLKAHGSSLQPALDNEYLETRVKQFKKFLAPETELSSHDNDGNVVMIRLKQVNENLQIEVTQYHPIDGAYRVGEKVLLTWNPHCRSFEDRTPYDDPSSPNYRRNNTFNKISVSLSPKGEAWLTVARVCR